MTRLSGATALALAIAAILSGVAAAAAPAARVPGVVVRLGRVVGKASPLLYGCSLPAPGTPGSDGLLPNLLRNPSFEKVALGEPKPMPGGWTVGRGWQLLPFGGKHMIVRAEPAPDGPLVLVRNRDWAAYRLTLLARKIDGPDGLCVLFDVQDDRNHIRWTLGANGNRQHVLESVGHGRARLLAPAVPGRIESGCCYKIEISLRKRVLQCSLDGRLVHQVPARFPRAGIGLGATESTAEYFGIVAHAPGDKPLFLFDDPAKARVDTLAANWMPYTTQKANVSYVWDALYPFNSNFSQSISVAAIEGGEAGIRQRGIAVSAGRVYEGRIHLRGTATSPVTVSLRDPRGDVLAAQEIRDLAGTWAAHDFTLRPSRSEPNADFCVAVAGEASVWVDQASLVAEGSRSACGLRSNFVAALRALRPALLCWPAGPSATHYPWQRGTGPTGERPVVPVTDGSRAAFEPAATGFGTDEFLALCREVGAEPLLVLNPRMGIPPVVEWLDYCNGPATSPMGRLRAANGHAEPYGVRFWLIGGERAEEVGAEPYLLTLARVASDTRGFRPPPQLIAVGDPSLADCAPDARAAKEAGPMVGHIARPFAWPADDAERPAALAALTAALKSLRSHSLSLALLDWSAGKDARASAFAAGAVLNLLTREAGERAIATFLCAAPPTSAASKPEEMDVFLGQAAASPAQKVWALFRSHAPDELLAAEVGQTPGVQLDAVAGRVDGKLVIRLVARAEGPTRVPVRLDGLGREMAVVGVHYSIADGSPGRAVPPSGEAITAVQGRELAVPLDKGESVHLIVLPCGGE